MSRYLFGCAAAGIMALATTVGAQDPPKTQEPRTTATGQEARKVTVEGCLMREADVPGRAPNVAERAGLGEDYILTSTKIIKGSAPSHAGGAKAGEPTGTAGTRAMMYEVEGIADEQLKQHVGQRVQIDGSFENVDRAQKPPESGTPADDLVELRGTTIRKVAGQCPAK
jgi:hypothetical protein